MVWVRSVVCASDVGHGHDQESGQTAQFADGPRMEAFVVVFILVKSYHRVEHFLPAEYFPVHSVCAIGIGRTRLFFLGKGRSTVD